MEMDGLNYNIVIPGFDPTLAAANAERLAEFDAAVRAIAVLAFGPGVRVERTLLDLGNAVQEQNPTAEGLLGPEVQAKLEQPVSEVFSAEALALETPEEQRYRSQIVNALDRKGVARPRDLYLLGPAVILGDRGLGKQALPILQAWLERQIPEMSQLIIDKPVKPEYAAGICTDLSQIRVDNIPQIFEDKIRRPLSLAEFEAQYMDAGRIYIDPRSDTIIKDYITRFKDAKARIQQARQD